MREPILILAPGSTAQRLRGELTLNGQDVVVVDRGDLASGTTAYSSRLIHGGLRYLEHGDFSLVRESLDERACGLRLAPEFVQPMRLFIPVEKRFGGLLAAARLSRISPASKAQEHASSRAGRSSDRACALRSVRERRHAAEARDLSHRRRAGASGRSRAIPLAMRIFRRADTLPGAVHAGAFGRRTAGRRRIRASFALHTYARVRRHGLRSTWCDRPTARFCHSSNRRPSSTQPAPGSITRSPISACLRRRS